MTAEQRPHSANAPGPFYVVDGCCTSCGVPEMAPTNFSFLPDGHCYVSRQPDDVELERVLRVVRTQEFACIRYRGSDAAVLRRLAEAGEAAQCDSPLNPSVPPVFRNFVSFVAPTGTIIEVLSAIRHWLLVQLGSSARATDIVDEGAMVIFEVSWFADDFHRVELRHKSAGTQSFILRHTGPLALSELIDDFLRVGPYRSVSWSSNAAGADATIRPW